MGLPKIVGLLNSNLVVALIFAGGMVYLGNNIGRTAAGSGAAKTAPAAPIKVSTDLQSLQAATKPGVVVIEYSDDQCPACAQAETSVVPKLTALASTGQIRFLLRDFPLPMHEHAKGAAESDRCAQEQGVRDLRKQMLDNHRDLSAESIRRMALGLGVNAGSLDSCLARHQHLAGIDADVAEGKSIGVSGTPSFLIAKAAGQHVDGELIVGGDQERIFAAVKKYQGGN